MKAIKEKSEDYAYGLYPKPSQRQYTLPLTTMQLWELAKSAYMEGYMSATINIEEIKKKAYNDALADAAFLGRVENAMVQSGNNPVYEYRIDVQSIMRLKK